MAPSVSVIVFPPKVRLPVNSSYRTHPKAKILWEGGSDARYVPTGHLVYALEDVLFALPFDLASLEVSGGPVPIVEGVQRASNLSTATANYGFSDRGTLIYVPGSGAGGPNILALADRNGAVEPLGVPPMGYMSPRLSPDGSRLVVQASIDARSDIWVYDLAGDTQIRRLTLEGNNFRPIWTPDGERVTFSSDRDGPLSIYWQAADGSGVVERLTTPEEGASHWSDSWSSDGRTLSFTEFTIRPGIDGAIWTLSLDEGGETTLFFDLPESSERLSQFSPDGRWLAYTGDVGGTLEVFVQPFPATSARYQVTQGGGAHPGWSRDGSEIFYRHPSIRTVRVVDVATDSGFSFGTERELPIARHVTFNDFRDYDITPDGQRFLMIFPQGETDSAESSTQRINVVLNWFEELKRLVPTDN